MILRRYFFASAICVSAGIAISLLAGSSPGAAELAEPLAAIEQAEADRVPAGPVASEMHPLKAVVPQSEIEAEFPSAPVASTTWKDIGPTPRAGEPQITQLLDECIVIEICVDHYLWELYQRTAKLDTARVQETRKVTFRRKQKTVTVTKHFTRLVPQDFTWKDPAAADKAGMPLMDYVIGGMEPTFKLKLFHALRAAEKAGLAPGITSGFRDDYRQSIATGMKAASNRSYHGGSLRGGYGFGIAADIVSTAGGTRAERWVSTAGLWRWIDANEQQYGIGRPYLGRDAPHVAPIDGEEYVSRRGVKTLVATSASAELPGAGRQ